MRRLWRDESGQVLPIVAIVALAAMLMAAMVLVAGTGYVYGELLQEAADASSLAAATTARPSIWFPEPVYDSNGNLVTPDGPCTVPDHPILSDQPCRVDVSMDDAQALAAAQDALQKNATINDFDRRGIHQVQIVDFYTYTNNGRAGAYTKIAAQVYIPMLEIFGSSQITMTREAKSDVKVDCGGNGAC